MKGGDSSVNRLPARMKIPGELSEPISAQQKFGDSFGQKFVPSSQRALATFRLP